MEIGNLTEARLNGETFAESGVGRPPDFWARPSLAPTTTPVARDIFFRQDAFGEEYSLQPSGNGLAETQARFGSPRTLIAGTGILAALAVGALAYFLWAPTGETRPTPTADSAQILQPVAPVPAAPVSSMPERSPAPPNTVAWPDQPSFR